MTSVRNVYVTPKLVNFNSDEREKEQEKRKVLRERQGLGTSKPAGRSKLHSVLRSCLHIVCAFRAWASNSLINKKGNKGVKIKKKLVAVLHRLLSSSMCDYEV